MLPEFIPERPRERCLSNGPRCLSFRECLAIILGSGPRGVGCLGLAAQLLEKQGQGLGEVEQEYAFFVAMESSASAHLSGIKGLGTAYQARILASFELARRYACYREQRLSQQRLKKSLGLPEQSIDLIPIEMKNEAKEWLGFIPLFKNKKLGGFCLVERGVRTHVNIDPAELFARVLALRPEGFFLFHNHPSGDLTPSPADQDLTYRVQMVSEQLGIRMLGHGILSSRGEHWIL